MKKWALSFGAEAEVLEPAKMREAITAEMQECLAKYSCWHVVSAIDEQHHNRVYNVPLFAHIHYG